MKSLLLALSLSTAAFLSACADLQQAFRPDAHAGATGAEPQRPQPSSSSDLGLF